MIRTIAAVLAAFAFVAFSARAEDKPAASDTKAEKKTEKKAKKSKKAKKAEDKPAAAAPAK